MGGVATTSCDQCRMALFPLLRAAHKQVLWASPLQQLASSASTVCSFGHTVLVGPAGTDFNIDGIAKGGKAARGRCSSAATAADVDSLTPERGWVSVQVDSSPSFLNAPLYA